MARAIALAERARPHAWPNPHVGCVIVRDGVVVGQGWTQPPGRAHAEPQALADAGEAARGATAYVTLEPCAHVGRTPACTSALIEAGIARVVVALPDPHEVAAGGADVLRRAGIEVTVGVLDDWVRRQLAAFLVASGEGRPHVVLKLAQTVDGALTAPAGRWITGEVARRRVHHLRARADAVLVGSGTVLDDDPGLDVRMVPAQRQPRPVVLDGRGRIPATARVVARGALVITAGGSSSWIREVTTAGGEVAVVGRDSGGALDLSAALAELHDRGLDRVFAEPGATLAAALVAGGHVDEVVRHVAPSVAASDGVARIVAPLAATASWPLVRRLALGPDVEIAVRSDD